MQWLFSKLFWLSVLLFLCYVRLASNEQEAAKVESARYCEDIAIWRNTKGLYGHPAYRGNRECGE